MEKIMQLLDAGSFMELGGQVCARSTDLCSASGAKPSDGVVTGYGTVGGKLVYLFAQDSSVMGGTFGEMHGEKIIRLYRQAMRAKAPVIGLLDCRGIRIEEGIDGLETFSKLYRVQAEASGQIPQLMAVIGRCGGGMSIAARMADFVFVEKENGELFLQGDPDIQEAYAEGSLSWEEITETIRSLIALLPCSADEMPPAGPCSDDLNRMCPELDSFDGDGRMLLSVISDDRFFLETGADHGSGITTGFFKLNGTAIGGVAACGKLTADGLEKAADFISLCDRYHIPVLTVTDTEGFASGEKEEIFLPKAAGRMVRALTCASVPKVNLIVGQIYGSAYSMMNTRGLGADYVFMWETAHVNVLHTHQALDMLDQKLEPSKLQLMSEVYEKNRSSADAMARRGYADKRIKPSETRQYLAGAFETFANLYR